MLMERFVAPRNSSRRATARAAQQLAPRNSSRRATAGTAGRRL
jgi:hypothetical protein